MACYKKRTAEAVLFASSYDNKEIIANSRKKSFFAIFADPKQRGKLQE